MIKAWFKHWLARYDAWCQELGLTPEHKRSCCAYRPDPASQKDDDSSDSLSS